VDPVTVSTEIEAPREQVFDYLVDIANHSEFTDHYLVDWHLTRAQSVGLGAGGRFRVKLPRSRFSWADVTIVELDPPERIVEVGRMGKANRIRFIGLYELTAVNPDSTRVEFTLETEVHMLSDRLFESLGQKGWWRRKNSRALRRLRSIIEQGKGAGERVTVAGR
jgi:uncharacterized protein YndB with AHSA1/START domain